MFNSNQCLADLQSAPSSTSLQALKRKVLFSLCFSYLLAKNLPPAKIKRSIETKTNVM